jgi:hypothetical protein
VLGTDHFWSSVQMYVVLGLFVFLAAIAIRTQLQRYVATEKRANADMQNEHLGDSANNDEDS